MSGVEHIELADAPPYRGFVGRIVYATFFLLGFYRLVTARHPRHRAALARLDGREWDLVVANDALVLPLAMRLTTHRGVVADLHEYAPQLGDDSLRTRLTTDRYFRWIIRTYVKRAAAVTTVSPGIADRYAREFGVRPIVVANAAPFEDRAPTPVGRPIRLVHSAAPSPLRRIETMIEAVKLTRANVTFDLYLVDDGSPYVAGLRALAADIDAVTIHDPVAQNELVETLARYDVGVHVLPPINFNHLWALPNKLFDFVQARLGIVIGPSPEMVRMVSDNGLGAVADDFSAASLARVLDALDPEAVMGWKRAADRAAVPLSGETQLDIFEGIVRRIVEQSATR